MDYQQSLQELQYQFPYHYIPIHDDHGFVQVAKWAWGMNYMGGIEAVLAQLQKYEFTSLIDIGCGDGRFLREVASRFQVSKHNLMGVDYSRHAISLANAMNPRLAYLCQDITHEILNDHFDMATMVEVLEHIPPADVEGFLASVARLLKPSGRLILTVPHINKGVSAKHYQHFSAYSLTQVLDKDFIVDQVIPFDCLSRTTVLLLRLLGYYGDNYIITNRWINNRLYKRVLNSCLIPQPENRCSRLLAIARAR